MQGVARHKDYDVCAVFFTCLRIFCMLVWDLADQQHVQVDVTDCHQWCSLPLFPLASGPQVKVTSGSGRRAFAAVIKDALHEGAMVSADRLHSWNPETALRSDACIEMLNSEMPLDLVVQSGAWPADHLVQGGEKAGTGVALKHYHKPAL